MKYKGAVKGGRVEFERPIDLPDGTLVEVHTVEDASGKHPGSRTEGLPDISDFAFDDLCGMLKDVDFSDDAVARAILEKHP